MDILTLSSKVPVGPVGWKVVVKRTAYLGSVLSTLWMPGAVTKRRRDMTFFSQKIRLPKEADTRQSGYPSEAQHRQIYRALVFKLVRWKGRRKVKRERQDTA